MEKEQALFTRKLLYRQDDRAYSDTFEMEISAISAMYAFSWMLPSMQHPITTRARIGIIYDHQENSTVLRGKSTIQKILPEKLSVRNI